MLARRAVETRNLYRLCRSDVGPRHVGDQHQVSRRGAFRASERVSGPLPDALRPSPSDLQLDLRPRRTPLTNLPHPQMPTATADCHGWHPLVLTCNKFPARFGQQPRTSPSLPMWLSRVGKPFRRQPGGSREQPSSIVAAGWKRRLVYATIVRTDVSWSMVPPLLVEYLRMSPLISLKNPGGPRLAPITHWALQYMRRLSVAVTLGGLASAFTLGQADPQFSRLLRSFLYSYRP
ncbi:hypothetical protein BDY21DRAFT_61100 [Lineolata rhizophorae]|uniref:Uncharacterized protein n=1 Tax=Lineolata rhizophorae TaxID=578093 RepID=A0A6A6NW49_9PEZI|nr:hypothetical protein BDY21DRAFT_61100 [Lineolata rhizophorae]